jgi:peptidoglycan hydrolase-like protein with peptidoglycan-binding domain
MSKLLRTGSRGEKVERLQTVLNCVQRPNPPLTIDGIFGQKTYNAVKGFQGRTILNADGIVGPLTSSELIRSLLVMFRT